MAKPHSHSCAVAHALNILGDRWSLLIVREALYGATRFGEFLRNTGISRNLLTERLRQLVDQGILIQVEFADRGTSFAYQLTEKGRALETVMVALQQWADHHVMGEGNEPVLLFDRDTGAAIPQLLVRTETGKAVNLQEVDIRPGPGADSRTRRRLAEIPGN